MNKKLSDNLSKILVRLIYLTPIGICINLFYLFLGKRLPGILIRDSLVFIKENPTIEDRIGWFMNGVFILVEGWYLLKIFSYYFGDTMINTAMGMMELVFLFGLTAFVAFVSCFYPRFPWNKPISLFYGLIIIFIFSLLIILLLLIIFLFLSR